MLVECPSGLKGTVRSLKLKEFADLSDPRLLRTGRLFTKLVSSCWISTSSPGPYPFGGDVLPWDNMLQGDLYKAFMSVRSATFGNDYGFERTCSNILCANKFECVVDIESMPIKRLPESSVLNVRNSKPFETKVAGKVIKYRLLASNDTQLIQKLVNDQDVSMGVAQIMARIVDIEGIERSDVDEVKSWLEELDMNDGVELREEMEAADCGVDTSVTLLCPKCNTEETVELPLGPTFFRKHKKTSNDSKKNVSSGSAP